jgi:hypothetical protein
LDRGLGGGLSLDLGRQCNAARPTSCGGDFHVAPMRDYTDRHLRHMLRLFSSRCVLWSEMEKASTVLARGGAGGGRGGRSGRGGASLMPHL